jgi:hypothetical protein
MAKQTFTTGQVLTAAQMTSLQQTAMLGGAANAKVASYVLVAADAGDAITMSNASPTTITVNTGLFEAGDIVTIINLGAGACTITAGTATVDTSGSLVLATNQGGVLRFTSASAAIFFQFATPASGDIEGVTAGTGISGGGTSGTVTITNSMATAIDAKGDLVVGTGADTFSRLAVGTNGHTLVADSAEATGLKWAAPAGGGGKVLQVVSASTTTKTVITSTSYTDVTNLTATITPSAATSKILVLITANAVTTGTSTTFVASSAQIVRGATAIMIQQSVQSSDGASATDLSNANMVALTYLDSPSTTSATTYKLQAKRRNGVNVTYNWDSGVDTNASTITLMEIGA